VRLLVYCLSYYAVCTVGIYLCRRRPTRLSVVVICTFTYCGSVAMMLTIWLMSITIAMMVKFVFYFLS